MSKGVKWVIAGLTLDGCVHDVGRSHLRISSVRALRAPLGGAHMGLWRAGEGGGLKVLAETNLCAKFQVYQIILTPRSMTLKF